MKKIFCLFIIVLFLFTSCNSPYKKRKKCRGNGSWYGNRNLGQQTPESDKTFVFK